jgi:hypothetical protein
MVDDKSVRLSIASINTTDRFETDEDFGETLVGLRRKNMMSLRVFTTPLHEAHGYQTRRRDAVIVFVKSGDSS